MSVILGLCVLYVSCHASHRLPRTLKPPPHFFRISSATSTAFGHLLPLWDCSNHCSHHGFFRCSSASASPASHAPSRVLDAPPLRDLRSFFPFLHSLILCACRCVSSYCTMITRLFSVLAERVRVVLRLRFQHVPAPTSVAAPTPAPAVVAAQINRASVYSSFILCNIVPLSVR